MREWLGLPVAASAEAVPIDQTLVLVHWLILVLFVTWSLFFIFVLIRFRSGAMPSPPLSRGFGGKWATGLELIILGIEIALIAFFSIPVWRARVNAMPVAQDAVILRVVAEQFTWNIHYPGRDGRFGSSRADLIGPANPLGLDQNDPDGRDDIATVNDLHLPVGRPAIIYLTSKDVIHSFTLPEMRVKQDTIPGAVQPVWFTPTRTGRWDIVCSQLCGLAHYRMRGSYVVESAANFDSWLDAGGR